jgi:hypothetical protein
MIRILDGPATGLVFHPLNAPSFLRVVQAPDRWDVLDMILDEVRPAEVVHVYALVPGTYSFGFACGRGRGAGRGGSYVTGDYRHVPDAPVDLLHDNAQWRAWAALTHEARCETGRPLPSAIVAELARLPVEDFRRAAAAIGAIERDDCWTLP